MLEDAVFILGGSEAGRGPAERGHCTPDGPERPEEETCPSPAGGKGSWTSIYVCVCVIVGRRHDERKNKKTERKR